MNPSSKKDTSKSSEIKIPKVDEKIKYNLVLVLIISGVFILLLIIVLIIVILIMSGYKKCY